MKLIKILLFITVLLSSFLIVNSAEGERTQRFEFKNDIKNNFCAVHINHHYCKCAFHNQYCESIDMSSGEADFYLHSQYAKHIQGLIKNFGEACLRKDGIWNKPSKKCISCDDGYVKDRGRCVEDKEYESIEDKYNLPDASWVEKPRVSKSRAKVVRAEGEVFVYSVSFGKWYGPVRPGKAIYTGDLVYTSDRGAASVIMYNENGEDTVELGTKSTMQVIDNSPKPERSYATQLYDGIMRIYHVLGGATNQAPNPFHRMGRTDVGVRGTEFIVEVDKDSETSSIYLIEGEIDLYERDSEEVLHNMLPGDSYSIDNKIYTKGSVSDDEWNNIIEENGIIKDKVDYDTIELGDISETDIDEDSVYPTEISNTGELAPTVDELMKEYKTSGSGKYWLLLIIILGGGYYFYKKNNKSSNKKKKKK